MKIIPFKIPKNTQEAFRVQVDKIPHLYNHLHQHPEIQLTLVKKSEGTLIAGDYVGRFVPGDVFVIGPNQPHVFRNDEPYFKRKLTAHTVSVFFDESTLGSYFWQLPETKALRFFIRNSTGGFRVTGNKKMIIAAKLEAIINSEGIEKIIFFLEVLKLLSVKKEMQPLSRNNLYRSIKTQDGSRLNRILEYTFSESHRHITLDEIAKVANLTVESFCKYFKTRTRKTYINFLNEIRIQHACRLLIENEEAVSGVCYSVGFNNLSHFNRVFKKFNGISPRAYRSERL
jgi:AraC-like DNA-binding protein/quercetin dioxygenase-like cupin family protein